MHASNTPHEQSKISMEGLLLNGGQIMRVRNMMCIISGIICGILGFTGLHGLLFFIATTTLTDLTMICFKMNFNLKEYTNSTLFNFAVDGITSTVMSFVLFWTLSFAVVYIY